MHPILIHVHAGNALHTIDTPVREPADLKGLKIRTPSGPAASCSRRWAPTRSACRCRSCRRRWRKHVVDGTTIPYEILLPLKIQELVKYHVEFEDGTRLGTAVFLFGMNKARYDSLPDDLKKVIDDNSGAHIARQIGQLWMDLEGPGRKAAKEAGNQFINWPDADKPKWEAAVQPAIDRWVKEVDRRRRRRPGPAHGRQGGGRGASPVARAMASAAGRPLGRFGQAVLSLSRGWAILGGLVLVAMLLMTVLSVLMRATLGFPIPGDYELIEIGTALAAFAFLPYCHQAGGNVLVDVFTDRMPERGKRGLGAAELAGARADRAACCSGRWPRAATTSTAITR